jgi:hypothetical protein
MLRKLVTASLVAAAFVGMSSAGTAPISFSSNGSFSTISGCSAGAFGLGGCNISGGGNNLDMSGSNNSTLTANDFGPVAFNTDANDVLIGQITWVNNASGNALFPTDKLFSVIYSLLLNFTEPNADAANQIFNLTVQQPTNPPGDTVNGFVIGGLPATFNLGGVSVTDIRFTEVGAGSFAAGLWSNPELGTSQLRLTADFTAVPEPATLTLFGVGILGLAALKRRRQQRKLAS